MASEILGTHGPREHYIGSPAPHIRPDPKDLARTRRALTQLTRAVAEAEPAALRRVLLAEAYASSLIENIDADPSEPDSYPGRLNTALRQALEPGAGLDPRAWHLILMEGHTDPRMTPGEYRSVNVRVGRWIAPEHPLVAGMMHKFTEWMSQEEDRLMRAVWGHRQFETIHPFADGNGRTGRLLICQTLGLPVMISRHVWHRRREYYDLLSESSWQEWSTWLLERIASAAYATARDLRNHPTAGESSDYRAVRDMINSALPRPARDADTVTLLQYHNALLPEL